MKNNKKRAECSFCNKSKIGWLVLIVYIIFVTTFFYFSLVPKDNSEMQSSITTDIVVETMTFFTGDKFEFNYELVHKITRKLIGHYSFCVIIGLLSFIWINLLKRFNFINTSKKIIQSILLAILIATIVSSIGELLQLIPTGRAPSITDVFINFMGHLTGIIISSLILIKLSRNKLNEN